MSVLIRACREIDSHTGWSPPNLIMNRAYIGWLFTLLALTLSIGYSHGAVAAQDSVQTFIIQLGENIVNEQLRVSDDGRFEIEFDTSDYLWYENGVYVIQIEDYSGDKNQIEIKVVEANSETESNQVSLIPPVVATSDNDDLSQLIEENKKLREELERQGKQIDDLNEQVDYLSEIIASIQGFFGSIFG